MKRTAIERRPPAQGGTALRPCGKRYVTADAAARSKRGQRADTTVEPCPCEGFHVRPRKPLVAAVKTAPRTRAAQDSFPAATCALIDARDSDDSGAVPVRLCQRCGATRNLHRHHRRLKGKGGTHRAHAHCACNGVTVCLRCHAEIHAHPERSEAEGWIVSQSVEEPGSVGVMRFAAAEGGATQWPSCDGRWFETAPEMREAA